MLLDDGGDMTLLVHYGLRAEQGDVAFLDNPTNEEEEVFYALIKTCLVEKPGWFAKLADGPRKAWIRFACSTLFRLSQIALFLGRCVVA